MGVDFLILYPKVFVVVTKSYNIATSEVAYDMWTYIKKEIQDKVQRTTEAVNLEMPDYLDDRIMMIE